MGKGYFRTEDGQIFTVPEDQVNSTLDSGFEPASEAEADAYDRDMIGGIESAPPKYTPNPDELQGMAAEALRTSPARTVDSREELGIGSQVMTAIENFGDGLLFNLPGALGAAVDPAYAVRAQARAEAFPATAAIATGAGIFAPSAATILKGGKLVTSIPKAIGKIPVVGEKVAPTVGATVAKGLEATAKLDFTSRAIKAVGQRGVLRKGSSEVSRLLRPMAEANVMAAENLAGRSGVELSEELVQAEMEKLAEQAVVARLRSAGANPELFPSVVKFVKETLATGATQAVAGAITGGIAGGGQAVKNAAVVGEDLAPAFWEGVKDGGKTGGLVGTAVGVGVPVGFKGLARASEGFNKGLQKLAKWGLPSISSRVSGASKETILEGYGALGKLGGQYPIDPIVEEITDALNKEYSQADLMARAMIPDITKDGFSGLSEAQKRLHRAAIMGVGAREAVDVINAQTAMESKWMKWKEFEGGVRRPVFDLAKIKDYVKGLVTTDATGKKVITSPTLLPQEILDYHDAVGAFTTKMEQLNNAARINAGRSPINQLDMLAEDIYATSDLTGKAKNAFELFQETEPARRFGLTTAELAAEQSAAGRGELFRTGLPMIGGVQALLQLGETGFGGAAGTIAGYYGVGRAADKLFNPAGTLETLAVIDGRVKRSADALDDFVAGTLGKKSAIKTTRGLTRVGTEAALEEEQVLPTRDRFMSEKNKIEMLKNPDETSKLYGQTFGGIEDFSEEADKSLKGTISAGVSFLDTKIPRVPANYRMSKAWEPTKGQMEKFLRYTDYVYNPDKIYKDVDRLGYVPDEGMEVLQTVYPDRLKSIKYRFLQDIVDMQEAGVPVPEKKRSIVNKLVGYQTDGLTLEQIKKNQDAMLPPEAKQPQRKPKDAQREATPTLENRPY